jgi:hypothetical protein
MYTHTQILKLVHVKLKELAGDEVLPAGVETIKARVTIDLAGAVEQKPAEEYTPTAEIPLLSVLAFVAQHAGDNWRRALNPILKACLAAARQGEPAADYLEHTKAALRKVREAVTRKLEKKIRAGKLKTALQLDVVKITLRRRELQATDPAPDIPPPATFGYHGVQRNPFRLHTLVRVTPCLARWKCAPSSPSFASGTAPTRCW